MAFGGFLVAFLLAGLVVWLAGRRHLAKELERVRASGEPVSVEDIQAFYEVPSNGRDMTNIWLTATAPLDISQFKADGEGLPFVGEMSDPVPLAGELWPQLDAAEQFLAKYEQSLEAVHRAARLDGQARYPADFNEGLIMSLPHTEQLSAGARLLELQTVVYAHRGRPDAAFESVQAMFAVARSLKEEPIVVSQLVRMGVDARARGQIAWLLSSDALDDDQLARLDADLGTIDYQPSFRRALIGERVAGVRMFADPSLLGEESAVVNALVHFAPLSAGDQALYLQILADLIAAADKIGLARVEAFDQAEGRFRERFSESVMKMRYPMTYMVVPSLFALAEIVGRHEIERDSTRLAVAIERFRRQKGRLPSKLQELVPQFVPQMPVDPFSGRPLVYRSEPNEYVVYSVGWNRVDDGGADEPPMPADLVVRVKMRTADTAASRD